MKTERTKETKVLTIQDFQNLAMQGKINFEQIKQWSRLVQEKYTQRVCNDKPNLRGKI